MAEKANGFTLEIAKADSTSGIYSEVKGLKELNIPSLQKESIDLTNFDQSVRSFMGGVIDYGELNFKTDFYPSHFNYANFPNDNFNHLNTVHDEISINGNFADTSEGGVADTGWATDTGGGLSITNGDATLDLSADTSDPSYFRRINVGGSSPVTRGKVYSAFYNVNSKTGTDGQLKWEYSGDLSSNQFYTTANGYAGYRTYFIPTETGFNNTGAIMNDHPSFKLYWAGDVGSSASVTFESIKLYQLFTWQDLFLNDVELTCRIKDPSGSVRFSFNGFLSGCEIDSPVDGIIEHNITLKVSGAVGYA